MTPLQITGVWYITERLHTKKDSRVGERGMATSKGIHRLSILAGIVGVVWVGFAMESSMWDGAQGLVCLVAGFLAGWGGVRLVNWVIKGFNK